MGGKAVAWAIDATMLVLAVSSLAILATGGGEWWVSGRLLRFYTAKNAIYAFVALAAFRIALLNTQPTVPCLRALDLRRFAVSAARFFVDTLDRLHGLDRRSRVRLLLVVIGVSVLVKAANAWYYFGFFSGDDVEIHEMTLASLFGWHWAAWNIRCAFYPMVFIYPVQALAVGVGVRDVGLLVFAGRMVAVAFSAAVLALTYRVGRQLAGSHAIGLIAVVLLAICKLHVTFASSELPRTVAGAFVLAAASVLAEWADPVFFGLAVWGLRRGGRVLLLWAVVPVLALSIAPHHEARYLVPVLPFLAIAAAIGLADVVERVARLTWAHGLATSAAVLALALAVTSMMLLEVDGWRFRRSESAVEMARWLGAQPRVRAVLIEST